MFHTRCLLFAAVLLASPLSASADEVNDAVAALDPAITHVRIFGEWKDDAAAGRYRAIIRRDPQPDTIRFYVQKVSNAGAVMSSIELTEVRTEKLPVSDYTFDIDDMGLTLFVETAKDGVADTTYEVFFNEDGSYTFQPASN